MTPVTKETLAVSRKSEGRQCKNEKLSFCLRNNGRMYLYAFLGSRMAYSTLENSPWMTFLNVEAKRWEYGEDPKKLK